MVIPGFAAQPSAFGPRYSFWTSAEKVKFSVPYYQDRSTVLNISYYIVHFVIVKKLLKQ